MAAGLAALASACSPSPGSRGSLVVFVVLDTIRADHLGACGETRPLTPVLDQLVRDGAALSCQAVAPGGWTLPSHASYFTGLEAPEHGAHTLGSPPDVDVKKGERSLGPARPLADTFPVLAESMPAVMVSGNPVLGETSGLARGFRRRRVARRFGRLSGPRLVKAVETMLADHVHDGDLLFVNIADAHTPWTTIPDDHPFLPARAGLTWNQSTRDSDWFRFVAGTPAAGLEARARDLYAYGVQRADHTLGGVLAAVEAAGFSRTRLVITSDHGEYLGEHGLMGHGHYLHNENQQVPLLVQPGTLPEGPINAIAVHDLVQGRPVKDRPVRAAAWPHPARAALFDGQKFADTSVRSWSPEHWWTAGEPVPEAPLGPYVDAVVASGQGVGDAQLEGMLEQLGYQ